MIFLARKDSTAWYAQWFSGMSGNLSGGFCATADVAKVRQREAPRKVTAFLMLLPPSTVGVSVAKSGDRLRKYGETVSVSRMERLRQQASKVTLNTDRCCLVRDPRRLLPYFDQNDIRP